MVTTPVEIVAGLTIAGAGVTAAGVASAAGWATFSSSSSGLQVQLVKINIKLANKANAITAFAAFIL
jgi:hypothetical protein